MACGGVWTDTAASRRITTTVDRELVGIAKQAAMRAAESEPPGAPAEVERICPVCQKPLACVRSGHVAVDLCPAHGTWFDRDELGRLARNLEYERLSVEPSRSRNAEMLLALLGREP